MSNDATNQLEEFFDKQLERINSWLTFAEAKHAAIIAFDIAAIAFVAEMRDNYPTFCTIIMLLFIGSSFVSLCSFSPITFNRPPKLTDRVNVKKLNLLFWGDIAKVKDETQYIHQIIERYFPHCALEKSAQRMCIDLACEIVINSRIANRKYELFKIALCIDVIAFLITAILLIVA